MVTKDEGNERLPTESVEDLIKRIDSITDSPEIRAGKVYALIEKEKLAIWDIVCFCMVFLTKASVMMEFLKPLSLRLHAVVYLAHYKAPEELGLIKNVLQDNEKSENEKDSQGD